MGTSNTTVEKQEPQKPKRLSRIMQAAMEYQGSLIILDPSILG